MKITKRLGHLLYFDIFLLFMMAKPLVLLIEGPLWFRPVVLALAFIFNIVFLLWMVFTDDSKCKSYNITVLDRRLWRMSEMILYLFLVLHVVTSNFSDLLQYTIYLLFDISVLLYIGMQVYFLKTNKW